MRTEKSLDGILKRYVFGELDDDARLALEERVVTEPEVFDALGVMEDELIEAYLEGTHAGSRTERAFEQHFMVSEDRRRQVSFIRMLKNHASAFADHGRGSDAHLCPGMVNAPESAPLVGGSPRRQCRRTGGRQPLASR